MIPHLRRRAGFGSESKAYPSRRRRRFWLGRNFRLIAPGGEFHRSAPSPASASSETSGASLASPGLPFPLDAPLHASVRTREDVAHVAAYGGEGALSKTLSTPGLSGPAVSRSGPGDDQDAGADSGQEASDGPAGPAGHGTASCPSKTPNILAWLRQCFTRCRATGSAARFHQNVDSLGS
jgi:hypothetical protein